MPKEREEQTDADPRGDSLSLSPSYGSLRLHYLVAFREWACRGESQLAVEWVTRILRESQGVVGRKAPPEASQFASGDSLKFITTTDRRFA